MPPQPLGIPVSWSWCGVVLTSYRNALRRSLTPLPKSNRPIESKTKSGFTSLTCDSTGWAFLYPRSGGARAALRSNPDWSSGEDGRGLSRNSGSDEAVVKACWSKTVARGGRTPYVEKIVGDKTAQLQGWKMTQIRAILSEGTRAQFS